MNLIDNIKIAIQKSIKTLYGIELDSSTIQIKPTNPEFEGEYTVTLFSFTKQIQKPIETFGNDMGNYLVGHYAPLFSSYNLIKGFLNLVITPAYCTAFLQKEYNNTNYGRQPRKGQKTMVEYSSPNTNKPLHLGHLRNNFLGYSIANILDAVGYDVVKTCVVNDRGVHICKSMIAWQRFANGATPASTKIKGDHFVGNYYVKFNDAYKKEVDTLCKQGVSKEVAEKEAPIMQATQQMLIDWENNNPSVRQLWKTMNEWVYEGFTITYKKIGSDFDKIYFESELYLLGKSLVESGLNKNIFYKQPDGSVWVNLKDDGLDEKLVQRQDGTSVYITQDIGLVEEKYKNFGCEKSLYVIGDEQNYHMQVLKLICQKLQLVSADGIEHLSYGMVALTTGKMKSREGTVVDADQLVAEMCDIAQQQTQELGKVQNFSTEELNELYTTIGLGALKFFLLRVDPKNKMVFNPEESIDFHGFTGPFIQYTHARIKSILRKANEQSINLTTACTNSLTPLEKKLLIQLEQFPTLIQTAADDCTPSKLATYVFNIAKIFNSFYVEHSIMQAATEEKKIFRLQIATLTAQVIKTGMNLLGITVPEKM